MLLTASISAAIVLIILAILTAASALILNRAARRAAPAAHIEIETGRKQTTGFELRFPRWIPFIECVWKWEPAEFQATVEKKSGFLKESIQPARRGVFDSILRRFSIGDVFGVTQISWTRRQAVELTVFPAPGRLDRIDSLFGFATGDDDPEPNGDPRGDRVEMRQYVPGDSPRMILWKVYARSGKLMVRVPERAVTLRPGACAYLIAGTGDDASAAVARTVIEKRLLGEFWCFGADGAPDAASDSKAAIEILARSGAVPESGSTNGFAEFLSRMEAQGYGHCVVFVPSGSGAWLDRLAPVLMRSRLEVQLIAGVDGIELPQDKGAVWHSLFREPGGRGISFAAIEQLRHKLMTVARRVSVVDATTGSIQ